MLFGCCSSWRPKFAFCSGYSYIVTEFARYISWLAAPLPNVVIGGAVLVAATGGLILRLGYYCYVLRLYYFLGIPKPPSSFSLFSYWPYLDFSIFFSSIYIVYKKSCCGSAVALIGPAALPGFILPPIKPLPAPCDPPIALLYWLLP